MFCLKLCISNSFENNPSLFQPFLPITYQPNSVRLPEDTPNGYQLPQFGLDLLIPTRSVLYRERPAYGCCALPITEILNDNGHILYQVKLESWTCCDPRSATVMTDLRTGSEVARFELDQKCGCMCSCFRAPQLNVTVRGGTTGETLGTVQLERVSCWRYDFKVVDGAGRLVVRVVNKTEWCTRESYHLLNGDGAVIGRIAAEGYHYYCYRMEFPEGLDVAAKTSLVAFLNLLVCVSGVSWVSMTHLINLFFRFYSRDHPNEN